MLLVLSLTLPALIQAKDSAAAACSKPDIERAAQQVQEARRAMRALPTANDLSTDVPPEAQRAIAAMKTRLGALADAYMGCAGAAADPQRLQGELIDLARGTDPDTTDENRYGGRIDFSVRLNVGPQRLLSIVAEFSIQCGSDAVLLVFAPESEGWREALRWHSKDYPTVAGAFWSFDYAISPPDPTGAWFVVAKNLAPWCTSTWSSIRYSVLRPRPAGTEPAELFRASDSIWWGGDDLGTLSVTADGFTLRYHGESKVLGGDPRQYTRRFRVSGDLVRQLGQ
ncbi:MAG: hypothetical protein JO001_20185 [Alphaproteobacteria bacterium]|nr:hypothetical protein [Alphaproteobacteria bacterium]